MPVFHFNEAFFLIEADDDDDCDFAGVLVAG